MKQLVLIGITFLATGQLFSADVNQDYTQAVSTEIQELIASFIPSKNLEESLQNLIHLSSTNKTWHQLLNDTRTIQVVLTQLSKKFDVSMLSLAFALNTPTTRAWIHKKNPTQEELIEVIPQFNRRAQNLEDYIKSIKTFASTNIPLSEILKNLNVIGPVFKKIGNRFNLSEQMVAFAFNTPTTLEWLKQKDPAMENTYEDLFTELGFARKENRLNKIGSPELTTQYFRALASKLGINLSNVSGNF